MPALLTIAAAEPGFSFADSWALGLLFLALALFAAIGALSHQQERAFSPSLVYLALGAIGAGGLWLLDIRPLDPMRDSSLLEHVTELAILVAVFGTGLRLHRAHELRHWGHVAKLLALVMPLTIAIVALFGVHVMGLSLGAAIVLGSILAPTDPVLAGDVGVGAPGEEEGRTEAEFALTAEAAANDGLGTPFLLLGILVAEVERGGEVGEALAEWLVADVLYAIVVAVAIGASGYAIAALFVRLRDAHLLLHKLDGWAGVATALAIFALAEAAGAYGFVAGFVGGLAFRRYEYEHEYNRGVHDGMENVEKFLEMAVILLLGSMLTLAGLQAPGTSGWLLAPLLLLGIRPLSVALSLPGSGFSARSQVYLAWFGVKGVASINYVAIAIGAGVLSAGEQARVFWTVVACVMFSIVVHGVSAELVTRRTLGTVVEAEEAAAPGSGAPY